MAICKWPLGDGTTLEFTIYDPNTQWNTVAGLYIFTCLNPKGWFALYVGKTDDFSSRLPSHDRWDEAIRKGATHIHAYSVSQVATRDKWEKMLIDHLRPPMNEQLK